MTTIVMDAQRIVNVTDNGPSTQVTVQSTGLQGPQGNPTTVNGHTGSSITLTSADVGAVATSTRGVANGVATLDSSALVPIAQIPTTALAVSFMDLSTNQTVASGIKTFSVSPVVPTPSAATQAANKSYVDSVATGLNVKTSSTCATAAALPTNTYANGTSGVGATLTATATGVLTVDGHAVALNDVVLVQSEATQSHNGLYLCTTAGAVGVAYVLTRAVGMDQAAEIPGSFSFVETGTVNAGAGFVVAGAGPYVVGTTAIVWTQFSGAGEITAGTGLTKSGNTLSLTNPVTIALGGTGQATQQAAINALTGTQSSGKYLRSDGTNATLSSLAAADMTGQVAIANGGTGSATQNFVDITTTQSTIAGAKTFTSAFAITNGNTPSLVVTNTTTGSHAVRAILADATSIAYRAEVTGDSVPRWVTYATGKIELGSGSATRDTNLYRSGVGTLTTDTAFVAGTTINGTTDIQRGGVSLSRGIPVAPTSTSSSGTVTSGTTETLDTVLGNYVFNTITGRRYQVFYTGLKGGSTAGELYTINIRDGGASTPTAASTLLASATWYCKATGGGGQDSVGTITDTFIAANTATHTLGAFAVRNAGANSFTPISGGTPRSLFVVDMGAV